MLLGLLNLVWQITIIVVPLMIFMQVLKEFEVIDKVTGMLYWTVRPFALPHEAVLPLLAGLIFGLVYGSGFIIHAAKEGKLTKRDLYIISLFLVINHSVLEDTMLFVAVGATGWLLITFRFLASILITWFVSKYIMPPETV